MAENTEISWAHNTFNPWWGCRQVSPACRMCYAKAWDKRFGGDSWGTKGDRRLFGDKHWAAPLKWNRDAQRTGGQVRVFCASMANVFEDHPALVEPRARLWRLVEDTPALTWMLLTKRPENVAGMAPWGGSWPGHVWLGCSAETQKFADQRLWHLVASGAAVTFVSAAPVLGPMNFKPWLGRGGVTWIITEGESGPKARPSHPDWFRSIRDQCATAGVAYHHKQWGEWIEAAQFDGAGYDDVEMDWRGLTIWPDGRTVAGPAGNSLDGSAVMWRVGKKRAGRLLDDREHLAFPEPAVTGAVA